MEESSSPAWLPIQLQVWVWGRRRKGEVKGVVGQERGRREGVCVRMCAYTYSPGEAGKGRGEV